jgi:hypothetical protein
MVLNIEKDPSIETQPYAAQAKLLKVLTHPVLIAI